MCGGGLHCRSGQRKMGMNLVSVESGSYFRGGSKKGWLRLRKVGTRNGRHWGARRESGGRDWPREELEQCHSGNLLTAPPSLSGVSLCWFMGSRDYTTSLCYCKLHCTAHCTTHCNMLPNIALYTVLLLLWSSKVYSCTKQYFSTVHCTGYANEVS